MKLVLFLQWKHFYWLFQDGASCVELFCYYVSYVSCWFISSLQPYAHLLGKGSLVCFLCFLTFSCGVLVLVWYLIVSNCDMCQPS